VLEPSGGDADTIPGSLSGNRHAPICLAQAPARSRQHLSIPVPWPPAAGSWPLRSAGRDRAHTLQSGTTLAACTPWRYPPGAVKGKRAAAVELRGTGKAAWGKGVVTRPAASPWKSSWCWWPWFPSAFAGMLPARGEARL